MGNAYDRMMGVGAVDILGAPEILGDPASMVEAAQEAAEMTRYTEAGYTASDKIWFGVGNGVVQATGTTVTYSESVATPFKPLKMTIASDEAPGLFITSIKIGPIELVDGAAIPAQTLSEVSLNNKISFPTAETSQKISVTVRNQSGVNRNVAISFYGVRLRK